MLFVQFAFLPFFLTVFLVHWALPAGRARKVWLLGASYWFYGAWDPRFLWLILFSTLLDYVVGLRLERPGARRRAWLALSLAGNLGMLAVFKYLGFFVDSAVEFLHALGFQPQRPLLEVTLPVGISFYTFQTLSYTLDVYRRRLAPTRDLVDLALFVAFFPQLVAGPIVRASEFLPQLREERALSSVDFRPALVLFLVGFFKKACVSDNLAPHVDAFFAAPAEYGPLSAWIAVTAYAVQIYCDFSGYSDMAIACAALLGYRLTLNFARPYLAASVTDFWRRWHISLSTWLRDYLYVPLGGNRHGTWRTYRNLMLTMLLGGLWHGAGWNFVIWGGLHGLALAVERALRRGASRPLLPAPLGVAATFVFVCLCWIFFRAQDLDTALDALRGFALLGGGEAYLPHGLLFVLGALAAAHVLAQRAGERVSSALERAPLVAFAPAYGACAALCLMLMPMSVRPFIYFQF